MMDTGDTDRNVLAIAETPTGELIRGHCRLRRDLGDMAVVIGPPGVGKSVALRQFAAGHGYEVGARLRTEGIYVAVTPDCANSLRRSLEKVLHAIIGYRPGGHPFDKLDIECSLQSGPIVVDEAQYLNAAALDAFRTIWDRTGTPFVFAGNRTFGDRFDRERHGALAQFASRIGAPLAIEAIQRGDVDAIGAANGVTDPDALDVLAFVASRADLRAVGRVVRIAGMIGDPNSEPMLREAAFIALGEELPKRLPRLAKILPFNANVARKGRSALCLSTG